MTDRLTDADLDAIERRSSAATDGPWFYNSYSTIFSSPALGRSEVFWTDERLEDGHTYGPPAAGRCPACAEQGRAMPCAMEGYLIDPMVATVPTYAGDSAIDIRVFDAEFIAHARADVPALLAEVRRLREEARAFAEALEFGNDRTEPAATLTEMLDPIKQAFDEARDHAECPVVCELCGERLAWQLCEKCYGSGWLSNAALAYLECDECAGAGMIHPDCAERTYAELAAEVRRLQATVERVRALHYQYVDSSGTLRPECKCGDGWPCPTVTALDGDEQ